ncbi:probable H/ACA ribonucleoprotein complex subunit 1 [Zootermopsis nevadensis]|uniref:probable H/ACA ribonucleoprotein complex subunit 1 n=1 Tax=Zootermopsis nevadensis TaxID=136037 RepID=UPI000B8ED6D8|nr:probable H/ACA ribonucleoprotein complex subunit 1 [Zootermopsis nevadensis]
MATELISSPQRRSDVAAAHTLNMKVLVLVAAVAVLVRARPEAGYQYSAPSNTGTSSFGAGGSGGDIGLSSLSGGGFTGSISSGASFGGGSLVQKHIYVHVPPPEPEEHINRPLPQFRPAQKHYKIVFIKAPTPPTPTAANIQLPGQDEQKTLIYVLVKKPDEAEELNIQQPAPTQPSKPEVYFIKYKTQKQITSGGATGGGVGVGGTGGVIGGIGGGVGVGGTGGVIGGIGGGVGVGGTGGVIGGISGGVGVGGTGSAGVSSNYGPPGASGPY